MSKPQRYGKISLRVLKCLVYFIDVVEINFNEEAKLNVLKSKHVQSSKQTKVQHS